MNEEIRKRIEAREVWTFSDCVGLAAEFNTKPRYVIGFVLALGRQYVDRDESPSSGEHEGNGGSK